jgi:hypothetical protein
MSTREACFYAGGSLTGSCCSVSTPTPPSIGDTVVQMLFWHAAETAEITQRQIEVAQWNDIAANYAAQTRQQLAELMEGFRPAKNKGRLLLWHGEPGTGKTFAIRALAWAWRDWCRFEYVIDPDRLFASPSYMIEVAVEGPAGHFLFDDKWNSATWRLLVIEDSGELMALDGRNQLDQALSRTKSLVACTLRCADPAAVSRRSSFGDSTAMRPQPGCKRPAPTQRSVRH